jgi:hypothetical protein
VLHRLSLAIDVFEPLLGARAICFALDNASVSVTSATPAVVPTSRPSHRLVGGDVDDDGSSSSL